MWKLKPPRSVLLKHPVADFYTIQTFIDTGCAAVKFKTVDFLPTEHANECLPQNDYREFVYGAPAVGKDGVTTGGGNGGGDVTKHTETRSSALSVYVSAAAVASALLIAM
ncbi:hypothetical protein PROFUN_05140 [Planoprotostelium fungivorum]|uniref:Uncharacterized protein n=1 Tax=Planoprotostelium fungivorum TaxID=1890364 RepID=A0A2P6NRT6_9EUKA|nr:hypothetical protein PROFUN_05140 [Planoprotostelium fungivorum]